ncbi:MAG: hypothetical protein ABR589_04395 [Chthoniobacterales bacterium]
MNLLATDQKISFQLQRRAFERFPSRPTRLGHMVEPYDPFAGNFT